MAKRRDHFNQLPPYNPWTFERAVALVGGVAGIAALGITFFQLDQLSHATQARIFVGEMSVFCVACIAYVYITNRRKLHRYAQSVFYVHFICHSVRDEIASMVAGKRPETRELMEDIVDATASCFSVLVGRRCRCCIVEMSPDQKVRTFVRDRLSLVETRTGQDEWEKISENTDFNNLYLGRDGCPRYFLSRNLVALWKRGKYKSSSFETMGNPEVVSWPLLSFIARVKWPLPYKSAIVWPIRFIPDGCAWPIDATKLQAMPEDQRPFVWGFLCVDCKSQNTFDTIYAPELGGAIADALFTLFHAVRLNDRLPAVDAPGCISAKLALDQPDSGLGSPGTNAATKA